MAMENAEHHAGAPHAPGVRSAAGPGPRPGGMSAVLERALDALAATHLGRAFPACAVAVRVGGVPLVERAWGACEDAPAHTHTWFDLASITKLFTATAFLGLVGEGRIGLDDPLVSVVPEFAAGRARPPEAGQDPHTLLRQPLSESGFADVDPGSITFRQLLTHTAGLQAWRDLFLQIDPMPGAQCRQGEAARAQRALALICGFGFAAAPGTRVLYSDLGFILLGVVVARLCGLPLEAAIRARVIDRLSCGDLDFNPLDSARMRRDAIAPTELDARWRGRRVRGEVHDENACAMGGVAGHAGLFGHAAAVAAFGEAWRDDPQRVFGIPAHLAREACAQQVHTGAQRRGLGFALKSPDAPSCGDLFSQASFGHTGYTGTSLWIDPQRGLVVACLTNAVYYGREMSALQPFRRALHDCLVRAVDP